MLFLFSAVRLQFRSCSWVHGVSDVALWGDLEGKYKCGKGAKHLFHYWKDGGCMMKQSICSAVSPTFTLNGLAKIPKAIEDEIDLCGLLE